MNKEEKALKSITKIEEKILVKKNLDKYYLYEKTGNITHSDFLDPYQQKLMEKVFSIMGIKDYDFFGGYEGAEREVIIFCPIVMPSKVDLKPCNNEKHIVNKEYDTLSIYWELQNLFRTLKLVPKQRNTFSHRDYLGSLMGLGIKREKIGDILVEEDFCLIIVLKEIAEFIQYNLTRVGNTTVDINIVDSGELKIFEPKTKKIRSTIASLRVDCVASAGFGISRNKIIQLIKSQRVYLDWELIVTPSKVVEEGSTISIKGKGRVLLDNIGRLTRKKRINVLLKKFI